MRVDKNYLNLVADEIVDNLLFQDKIKEEDRGLIHHMILVILDEWLNINN